jgi:2,3-dihydroxy-2,3-dihydro-p-cumate dehydrogenase
LSTEPLKGRIAIVTGAGHGLGAAIASRLSADGATVMVADLEAAAAEAVASALGAPARGASFAGDLSQEPVAGDLLRATVELWGGLDILVNNAGGGILRPFLEHTPETLRATVDRNLWTTVWCCWHALPRLKARGGGRIINIGADSVRNGLVDHAGYNAAKGGVHGLTTGLAREFAPHGVTVNTVAPCAVQTRQLEEVRAVNPDLVRKVVEIIPLGRPAKESEVAGMVAYLAGDDAAFVTGQVISVNGGTTML